MAEKNMDEDIIDLTEVVDEELNPAWKIGREAAPAVEPAVGIKKEKMGEPEMPRKKLDLSYGKEDPTQKIEPEPLRRFSPGAMTPKPATPQSYEPEVLELKDVLRNRAEEWISRQGVQIMEQIAREMFPKIAQDVLRREIEKIKAEAKDEE
jgi:hypothetical protein